jgi:hypothetical protein
MYPEPPKSFVILFVREHQAMGWRTDQAYEDAREGARDAAFLDKPRHIQWLLRAAKLSWLALLAFALIALCFVVARG